MRRRLRPVSIGSSFPPPPPRMFVVKHWSSWLLGFVLVSGAQVLFTSFPLVWRYCCIFSLCFVSKCFALWSRLHPSSVFVVVCVSTRRTFTWSWLIFFRLFSAWLVYITWKFIQEPLTVEPMRDLLAGVFYIMAVHTHNNTQPVFWSPTQHQTRSPGRPWCSFAGFKRWFYFVGRVKIRVLLCMYVCGATVVRSPVVEGRLWVPWSRVVIFFFHVFSRRQHG